MRKTYDFHGGIYPPENKQQSLSGAIQDAGVPPRLVIPLSQHIGAPARALVSIGEQVLKGQVIAEAVGPLSIPQHASSSGRVVAIEERPIPHPSGLSSPCVVIDCDGEDRWAPLEPGRNYRSQPSAELLARVRRAGIAGMGGAGFPAAVKLAGKAGARIDTLIINGTECEPYITADDALMREYAADIASGAAIIAHILKPQEVLIGIENNKPEAIAAMRTAVQGQDQPMSVVEFTTKYPSGGERQLI